MLTWLTYDNVGRLTFIDSGSTKDYVQRHFTYDGRNRLASYLDVHTYADSVQEACPDHQITCDPPPPWDYTWYGDTLRSATYAPDYSGNRTDGSASLSNDRLSSMTGADGRAYTLTYNNEGRLTAKTASGYSQTYGWNALGELRWVKTNGDSVAYGYDAQGRRVRKYDAGTTTRYVWDGAQLLMQLDGSGNRTLEYSYRPGLDAPVAVRSGSSMYYYQLDETGSVAALWNTSNSPVATYTYDPYGYTVASSGSLTQPLRWKGAQYDSETGLYYMRARYYDPTVGRFISEDPIGLAGGINPYAYADGDPVNGRDPSGMTGCVRWGPVIMFEDIGFVRLCEVAELGGVKTTATRDNPGSSDPHFLDPWGDHRGPAVPPGPGSTGPGSEGGAAGGSSSAQSSDASDKSRLTRYTACIDDTPGISTMAALSILPLGNMKLSQGFRLPGSSVFTSIDRRFPWLPFANTEGGVVVRVVGSGAVKTAGRLGTIGAVVGTFATSYTFTTIARCLIESW